MAVEVEYTDIFKDWWDKLDTGEQESVAATVAVLETLGTALPFPYSSSVKGSEHSHMRELRIQHKGKPYRVLYAFDPGRVALLLLGGSKTGDDRWYTKMVPKADELYDDHLKTFVKENQSNG